MAFSISDVLAIIQNGVTAVNNLNIQLRGSLTTINSRLHASPPGGRLTLQSGVPVMTTTQINKTTLYYTQYSSAYVPMWDGAKINSVAFNEISALTTDTTKSPAAIGVTKVNDWFVWNDAGTVRLSHGPDWTSDTVRSAGAAIGYAGLGFLVNTIAITNGPAQYMGTYVGTTRSSGISDLYWQIGGTGNGGVPGFLFVWNMYNRVVAHATSVDNTSYTYTSGVVREAHALGGNIIYFVTGAAEDAIDARLVGRVDTLAAADSYILTGFGLDGTAGFTGPYTFSLIGTVVTNQAYAIGNSATFSPQLGVHFIARLEAGDGVNANTANNSLTDFISVSLRM